MKEEMQLVVTYEPVRPLKAYCVFFQGEQWADYVHATSALQARYQFYKEYSHEDYVGYIDTRARRVPFLDDKPLTGENIVAAGGDPDWVLAQTYTCTCGLCKDLFLLKKPPTSRGQNGGA